MAVTYRMGLLPSDEVVSTWVMYIVKQPICREENVWPVSLLMDMILLWHVMLPAEMQAFDGLGPEVTNSRLAMLGFAIAAFWELTQGLDVFQQVGG